MRSKWKVGLVLAIALLLATAVAGAWTLSRSFIEKTAELQLSSGYYDDWSLEEKRGFVDLMAEYELVDQDTARKLKGWDEEGLDAWMAVRYGVDGRTDVIGLTRIAEVELGSMETWSNDTWVWYTELELRTGQLSSMDPRICVVPGDEAVPPEAAIAAVKEAACQKTGMAMEAFASAQVYWTYEVEPEDTDREDARYFIRMEMSDGSNIWGEVLRDGTVDALQGAGLSGNTEQGDAPETLSARTWAIEKAYMQEHGLSDYWLGWPLEDRAALAVLEAPVYKEALLAGDEEMSVGGIHAIVYTYGVPDEQAIPQEQALALARQAIADAGVPEDVAARYVNDGHPCYYYTWGAAPQGHPAWEFGFWYEGEDLEEQALSMVVQLDAYTGEILQCAARTLAPIADGRVEAVMTLLEQKGAPENWSDEEWTAYLPWDRE